VTPEPAAAKSAPEEAKQTVPSPAPLEDIAKIGNERGAPEPAKFIAPLAESAQPDSPPVPLGDIARQYREQKLAREKQARVDAQPPRSSHVYSNEDLARPTILTPEDHEVFEAAQKKLPPAVEQKAPEIEAMEQSHFSPSLGDIARLYRRQVPIPQITQPNRFPLLLGMTAFAAPSLARSVIRPPPRVRRVVSRASRKFRLRRTAQRLTRTENLADQTITVKPGDTLWSLARQYLGQRRRWRELQESNSWIRDPHYLRIGSQIRI
jgi:nucleoid-associated protein YgaU